MLLTKEVLYEKGGMGKHVDIGEKSEPRAEARGLGSEPPETTFFRSWRLIFDLSWASAGRTGVALSPGDDAVVWVR